MPELLDCVCGSEVIICIDGISTWFNRPYVIGTILSVVQSGTYCNQKTYRYSLSYDSDAFLDPSDTLTTANITGVVCKDCLTTYIESLVSEVVSGGYWAEVGAEIQLAAPFSADDIVVSGSDITALSFISLTNISIPTTDATHGQIIQNGNRFIHTAGTENIFIGLDGGNFTLTGDNNIGIGRLILQSLTTGTNNIAIGSGALNGAVDAQYNVAIGTRAGFASVSGYNNIFIGFDSGFYETGSNTLMIDTITRADEATQRVEALIYGIFDPNPVFQMLTVNGHLNVLSGQDLIFGSSTIGATIFSIRGARADGSDDGSLQLGGGGGADYTRGATIHLNGNEFAVDPGCIELMPGETVGSIILYDDSNVVVWTITDDITGHPANAGNLVFGPSGTGIQSATGATWSPNGGAANNEIVYGVLGTPTTAAIISQTVDGADDAVLSVCGGGAASNLRGARIDLYGNEQVGNPGRIDLVPGSAASGEIYCWYNGNYTWVIGTDIASSPVWGGNVVFNTSGTGIEGNGGALWKPEGSLSDNALVFSDVGTASAVGKIRASTADAADDALLHLCGGGEAAYDRGARIDLGGNEHVTYPGRINLYAGTGGWVDVYYTDVLTWSFTDNLTGNATNGGNVIFQNPGKGVVDATESLAATGSVLADAAQITYRVTFVTASDGVKGVKLPATPDVGASYRIYNTANAILLVYPGAAGDQINAAGAGVAVSIAAYASLEVTALSASQWWGGESANP